MLFYLKLGLRNLLKNKRRSVKTILVIVIGLSACLLAQGFMSHTLSGLGESLINGGLGHIQIYRKGYLEYSNAEPYQYLISNPDAIIEKLKDVPGKRLLVPSLNFQGIISSGEKSTIFMGTAGPPQAEQALNTLVTIKDGSFLKDEKPYGIMIGSGVARKLNVGVGDTVTLMSALTGGGINAQDMEIIGVIEAQIKAYDETLLLANLEIIRSFLDLPNSADRIVLLETNTEEAAIIEPHIRRLCDEMDLEYRDWRQLAGIQYTQPKLFYDLVYVLIMAIIVLVVIFSITNTLNLSMQERIKEIGTIRSLGTSRLQVSKIFISESFLVGLSGGLFGVVAGYGGAALLNALGGVPIPPPPGHARGYIAFFRPDFIQALRLGMLFLITATLAGFYPAYKAARLRIVDALRWI